MNLTPRELFRTARRTFLGIIPLSEAYCPIRAVWVKLVVHWFKEGPPQEVRLEKVLIG